MSKLHVLKISPFSGIGKASGKAFSMLKVDGAFTDDEGNCEIGEYAFFADRDGRLPSISEGKTYTPIFSAEKKNGVFNFKISSLKEVAQPKVA